MSVADEQYLKIVLEPIYICAKYMPRFGQGISGGGLSLHQFQKLYRADPLYSWFGLDNPLMYAAHKAAGGMTSVYRQIGIGCEALFRRILQDSLGLSARSVRWSYQVQAPGGRTRTLSLDGRVPLPEIKDTTIRQRFHEWMRRSAESLDVDRRVFSTLVGTVFEVRQGYKSKDSKRQNADLANAATAYTKGYLPCAVILSAQIDSDIFLRYRAAKWAIVTGLLGENNPLLSTYDFMKDVIGYDLAAFFERNSVKLHKEIDGILRAILTPETK